jgi:hypothetical protein
MRPSVFNTTISPYGAGPQTLHLLLACIDLSTGNFIPNATLQVVPSAEADSGGHLHNTNRPAGSFSPDHGVSGPSTFPFLRVDYTAPEASGITDMIETCSAFGGPPVTAIFTIGVEIDGLELATGSLGSLFIVTTENLHGNNNGNATPGTISELHAMAGFYVDLLTQTGDSIHQLRITALSLPQGGLFDYQTEWSPPHKLHRNGTDADLGLSNLTTTEQRIAANEAFLEAGFRAPVEGERPEDPESDHWHLKARGGV